MYYSNDKIVKVESNRRAKKLIVLISEKQAIKFAIENNNSRKRYSLLSERIKKESK